MLSNRYKDIQKVTLERKVYCKAKRASEVWKDVVEHDAQAMRNLSTAMSRLVFDVGVPRWLVLLSAKLLYHGVYKKWGHYIHESDYFAKECSDISASLMAFLQRQYTLAHMGCSVVMVWDEKTEQMVCFRSLDWKGADDIARSSRRFSFVNQEDEEIAQVAGITAMVGVLTGAKRGFSVAINYAPWKRSATFKSDPTFLIRQLLEDESITDYKHAQEHIVNWKVGSPCFISLCGINRGEACVIELGSQENVHIREIGNEKFLIQTNHYDLSSSPFTLHNEPAYIDKMSEQEWYGSELLRNSQERERIIRQMLEETSELPIAQRLVEIYKQVPVLNWETAQWVIMRPKSGEIDVYSCEEKLA